MRKIKSTIALLLVAIVVSTSILPAPVLAQEESAVSVDKTIEEKVLESEETSTETPEATPEETPTETPEATPEETPAATPEETPTEETPEETPTETPEETPTETPASEPEDEENLVVEEVQEDKEESKTKARSGSSRSNTNDDAMNTSMQAFLDEINLEADTDKYNTGEVEMSVGMTYAWRKYVNRIWEYKAMGSIGSYANAFKWNTSTGVASGYEWDGTAASTQHTWLSGTKLGASVVTYDPTGAVPTLTKNADGTDDPAASDPTMVPFSTVTNETGAVAGTFRCRTFYVYSAQQFFYAFTYYRNGAPSGDDREISGNKPLSATTNNAYNRIKIVLMRNIDLQGADYNWPVISFYFQGTLHPRLELEGNGYTVFNLGQHRNLALDDSVNRNARGAGLAIGYAGIDATDITFSNCKVVATEDSQAPTVGILGRAEANATANYSNYGNGRLENVKIKDSLCFSGVEASNVSAFGSFAQNKGTTGCVEGMRPIDMKNCSVEGCFLYGGDHVAGLTTANSGRAGSESEISYSYVTNTLIATYGGHSGGFVSCHFNHTKISNCYSNVDMYAAAYSGGFVGLFAGTIDNCYSTGKLEGFKYCGGFSASVPNAGIGQDESGNGLGATVTNCYSTTLVGMRQDSSYMGGFHSSAPNPDKDGFRPLISSYTFTNCYAAGEVGDEGLDTEDNALAARNCGGFMSSVDKTGNKGKPDSTTNCYYDKQTTAMKERVTGDYSTRYDSDIKPQVSGVTGLMTQEYNGTPGLTGTSFSGLGAEWTYTTFNYPQLSVFLGDAGWSEEQKAQVKADSQASTATVFLDSWAEGYEWDGNGVRSKAKVSYNREPDGTTHKGNKYSYDTVRGMVTNAPYSQTSGVLVESLIDTSLSQGTVELKDGMAASTTTRVNAFDLSTNYLIQLQAPGMGWLGLYCEEGSATTYRPIRLISSVGVEAGENQEVYAGCAYNHRTDVRLQGATEVVPNRVVGLDDAEIWSYVYQGGYPVKTESSQEGDFTDDYYHAYSYNMDRQTTESIHGAWLNTEIWRVYQTYPNVTFTTDQVYTGEALPTGYQDENRYYWYAEHDIDDNWAVYLRESVVPGHKNPDVDLYVPEYSVNINGEQAATTLTLDEEKWNGQRSLYPDTSSPRKYVITYFWLAKDGRYRTDYKTVNILPGYYNMYMTTHSYKTGELKDAHNNYALKLEPTMDALTKEADEYQWNRTYDLTDNYTESFAYIGGDGAEEDLPKRDNDKLKFTEFTTDKDKSIPYTNDSTAAWEPLNDDIVIRKMQVVLYARNGDVVGEGSATLGDIPGAILDEGVSYENGLYIGANGNLAGAISMKTQYYGTSVQDIIENGKIIQREVTTDVRCWVTYRVEHDSDKDVYYLKFDKGVNLPPDGPPVELTTQDDAESGVQDGTGAYINDTQYHIRVDFWVDTYDLTLEKKLTGNYTEDTDKFNFNVELNDLETNPDIVEEIPYYSDDTFSTKKGNLLVDNTAPTPGTKRNATATVDNNNPVVLGDMETMVLQNIPVGVKYTMVEAGLANEGRTPEDFATYGKRVYYKNNTGDFVEFTNPSSGSAYPGGLAYTAAALQSTGMVTAESYYIRYRNHRDVIVPTNAETTDTRSYLLLIVFAIGAGLLLMSIYIVRRYQRRRP